MKLIQRTEIKKPMEVYNLHIENDHNYIVDGAVVANCHMAKAEVLKTMLTGVMGTIPIRWGLTGTIPKEPYEFVSLRCSIGGNWTIKCQGTARTRCTGKLSCKYNAIDRLR